MFHSPQQIVSVCTTLLSLSLTIVECSHPSKVEISYYWKIDNILHPPAPLLHHPSSVSSPPSLSCLNQFTSSRHQRHSILRVSYYTCVNTQIFSKKQLLSNNFHNFSVTAQTWTRSHSCLSISPFIVFMVQCHQKIFYSTSKKIFFWILMKARGWWRNMKTI